MITEQSSKIAELQIEKRLREKQIENHFDAIREINNHIDQIEKESTYINQSNEKPFTLFNEQQLLKLLCVMERSVISTTDEEITESRRKKLIEWSHDLTWDIAEYLNLDLNEGSIDIDNLTFKEF